MSMKEIKNGLNSWRVIPWSWTGRLNTVKVSILPKMIYRFTIIPINISVSFFVDKSFLDYLDGKVPEYPKQFRKIIKEEPLSLI